jgi:hypothetical protein
MGKITNINELMYSIKEYEPNILRLIYNYYINNIIYEYINKYINNEYKSIVDGYQIIDQDMDGCDEYGPMYWILCENGWGGRDWEKYGALDRSVIRFKNTEHEYNISNINSISLYDKNQFIKWMKINMKFNFTIMHFNLEMINVIVKLNLRK